MYPDSETTTYPFQSPYPLVSLRSHIHWNIGYPCFSDIKVEPNGMALGLKSGTAGLLHGLNASCWAHAGLRVSSLMLKGTVGLDVGI